jgi:hypothetical protein
MKYRTIGTDPATRREVSVLSLGAMLMGSRTDEATSFAIGGDLLSYLRSVPGLTLVAYSPLLSGAYVRADRPLGAEFLMPGRLRGWLPCRQWRLRRGRRLTRWCWRG